MTPKPKQARGLGNMALIILGGLFAGVGLLSSLLFTLAQFTYKGAGETVLGYTIVVGGCLLPLTLAGGIILAVGITRSRRQRAAGAVEIPPGGNVIMDASVDHLVKKLKYGTKTSIQVSAIRELGELKARAAIPSLVEVAQGKTVNLRSSAASEMIHARLDIAVLRQEVAKALEAIGGAEVIRPLIDLLAHDQITNSDLYNIYAHSALVRMGAAAEPALKAAALFAGDASLRIGAEEVLREIQKGEQPIRQDRR